MNAKRAFAGPGLAWLTLVSSYGRWRFMDTHSISQRLLLVAGLLTLAACGDSTAPTRGATPGAVRVTATTTGADLPSAGYNVSVDSGAGQAVATNGAVTISGLKVGRHSVTLYGLASNCALSGVNTRAVDVIAGDTAVVAFDVGCTATSGANGEIAFASHRDGTWAIYTMGTDGSHPTRLTRDPCDNRDPAWSPDGRRIAFTAYTASDASAAFLIMNADGSGETGLCGGGGSDGVYDMQPAWSPDGTKIAFIHQIYGDNSAYVTNVDGTGSYTQLTHPEYAESPYDLAWSPDGQKIAYADAPGSILVMDAADGSNKKLVMRNGEAPAWSPDGTKIAFQSNRDGNYEIYVMNADGSNPTRLTNDPRSDLEPDWSPDGTKIVFASNRDGSFQIYVMSADGSGVDRLTNDPAGALEPRWKASR